MASSSPVTLVSRDQCFRENPVLAHAVAGWQQAHAAGDEVPEWWANACDDIHPDAAIRWAGSLTLYLPASSIDETAEEMGPALSRMLAPFGGNALTFFHAWPSGRWATRRRSPPVPLTGLGAPSCAATHRRPVSSMRGNAVAYGPELASK